MGSREYAIALFTCLGGLTFGYDTGILSGILTVPSFQTEMGITIENQNDLNGTISSVLQIGGLFSALIQFYLNDRFGRRDTIMMTSLVFIIGAFFQTVCWNLYIFYLGRLLSGFGLFCMIVSVALYNAEMASTHIRGRIVGIQQLMVVIGSAISYWINYFITFIDFTDNPPNQFRIPLGLQLVPSIILFCGCFFIPRSARWLCMKSRFSEAKESLAFIRELSTTDEEIQNEIDTIQDHLRSQHISNWSDVFSSSNLDRLYIGVVFVILQQFAGQNLIHYFAPVLFQKIGLNNGQDLLATGFVGIVKLIMTIPALMIVDVLGRRPLMLFGTLLMASSFMYIGVYIYTTPLVFNSWGYGAIGCIYIFMTGYTISWGIMHYVIPSEIYPVHLRAKSGTVGILFELLFQVLSIKTAPTVIHDLPNGGVFFLYTGFLTLFLLWIYFYLPETKGVPLEDIDEVIKDWNGSRYQPVPTQIDET
ncbi:general substrate transporter [Globomyces pollinis-pini]|nr:general substrate transporter [Globomyces pollinis-pini]